MNKHERQLLLSVRKGDVGAFEELAEPYFRQIYGCMLNSCGDEYEAYRLAQEVFVRAFRTLASGGCHSNISLVIYRTAGEVCRQSAVRSKMISRISGRTASPAKSG